MARLCGAATFIASILLVTALWSNWMHQPGAAVPDIHFSDHTEAAGLVRYSPTFSAAVTDLDNDGDDDLIVGNHGHPPAFYLNDNGKFAEQHDLNPLPDRDDRHVYTFVDLDNDGDRDFLYAGGGADGIGVGSDNRVFQNQLVESGSLGFMEVSAQSDIAYPHLRARVFYPLAAPTGERVDLYLTALHKSRHRSTNLYVTNSGAPGNVRLNVAGDSLYNLPINSDGYDVVFDYDRDGDQDFLNVASDRAALFENIEGQFKRVESAFDELYMVCTAAVADFNNDGFLDVYVGATSGHSGADNVSASSAEIHFVIERQDGDVEDSLIFTTTSDVLEFDFAQRLPEEGRKRTNRKDIFLGRNKKHPWARKGRINSWQALGKPEDMGAGGTYIWRDNNTQAWHVVWRHETTSPVTTKGIISADDIVLTNSLDLETPPLRQVQDYILINESGRKWRRLSVPGLEHQERTSGVTAADFNNDGLIDIAGLRSRDQGKTNGEPFLLTNRGKLRFTFERIMQNETDDMHRADTIVHGFFNNDGLPDLFFTNGFGLMPGHVGPYQMWLNTSPEAGGHAIVSLEGARSNRDAIGAQVELYTAGGRLLGYREIGPGFGRGQDTLKLHFGLGNYEGPLEARVRWPGAPRAQSYPLPHGGSHLLRER